MLLLVGTGISYDDISIGAIEACRGCELYAERYTSAINDEKLQELARIIGGKPKILQRGDLEENAKRIVNDAKSKNVAVLVGGDPLMATTHKILLIEAHAQGVETKVFHASSIFTAAIGESGLDFYRFGQTCTIPRWSRSYKPVSFYETISRNVKGNLHSLVLLDYDAEKMETLPLNEAAAALNAAEDHYKERIINEKTKVFIVRNVSTPSQAVITTNMEGIASAPSGGMATLILPAKLSKVEEETVESIVK